MKIYGELMKQQNGILQCIVAAVLQTPIKCAFSTVNVKNEKQ